MLKQTFPVDLDYRVNNLNLIRLLAAFQVVIGHLHQEFPVHQVKWLTMFNGVPIFFTISGFLIFWSFDNNPNVKQYFVNRCLRIYPALIAALVLSIILMFLLRVINISVLTNTSFYLWICTQLTFMQEFTPEVVKGFGKGSVAPNNPLWTISVEMLLYMFIPILYKLIKRYSRHVKALALASIGLVSYCQNQSGFITDWLCGLSTNGYWQIFIWPFCQFCSFAWFFVVGILIYLYKDILIPKITEKGGWLLLLYVILCIVGYRSSVEIGSYTPWGYSLFLYFVLIISVFSLAYTKPTFTKDLMGKTDISYGLYIYHMLILKTFSRLGLISFGYMLLAILLCFLMAYISWAYIEKKALKLKEKSLYKGA